MGLFHFFWKQRALTDQKQRAPSDPRSFSENLEIVVARWRKERIGLLPPEPPERVAEVFASLGLKATGEMLELYAQLGGMRIMDDEDWRLWSLDEIREENKESSPDGVLFSDYLIDCWRYRLKATADGEAEVLIDRSASDIPPRRIARSLNDFFAAYVEDAQEILND